MKHQRSALGIDEKNQLQPEVSDFLGVGQFYLWKFSPQKVKVFKYVAEDSQCIAITKYLFANISSIIYDYAYMD